jgi:hypothetical protein
MIGDMGAQPVDGGGHVFAARGPQVIGGEAIVHHRAHHAHPRRHRPNGGIGPVTRLLAALVAQHEAAAMDEEQHRFEPPSRRHKDPAGGVHAGHRRSSRPWQRQRQRDLLRIEQGAAGGQHIGPSPVPHGGDGVACMVMLV